MNNWKSIAGQGFIYCLIFGAIGYLSNRPLYYPLPAEAATIKLTLRHPGKILGECQTRSAAEMAALPANMRIAEVCPRERSSVQLDLIINDKPYFTAMLEPSGFQKDGMSSLYKRLTIPAGKIKLAVRMKDHVEQVDYPYQLEKELVIKPAQVLVIDFNSRDKAFRFL